MTPHLSALMMIWATRRLSIIARAPSGTTLNLRPTLGSRNATQERQMSLIVTFTSTGARAMAKLAFSLRKSRTWKGRREGVGGGGKK
jgi:hypothetical protein